MPQFDVHRNANPDTKADFPFLLDVQNNLLADLGTRVVVPLCPILAMKDRLIKILTPVFEIDGESYAMLTPQLAGVSRKQLGARVTDLSRNRGEIVAALDLLITGI